MCDRENCAAKRNGSDSTSAERLRSRPPGVTNAAYEAPIANHSASTEHHPTAPSTEAHSADPMNSAADIAVPAASSPVDRRHDPGTWAAAALRPSSRRRMPRAPRRRRLRGLEAVRAPGRPCSRIPSLRPRRRRDSARVARAVAACACRCGCRAPRAHRGSRPCAPMLRREAPSPAPEALRARSRPTYRQTARES